MTATNLLDLPVLTGGVVAWADTVFDLRIERPPLPATLPARDEERSSVGHGWTFDSYSVGHNPDKPNGRNYTVVVFTDPDGFRFALAATSPSAPRVPSPKAVGNFAPAASTLLSRDNKGNPPKGLGAFFSMRTFERWRDAAKDPVGWLNRPEVATVADIDYHLACGICRWASKGVDAEQYPFEYLREGFFPSQAAAWAAAGLTYPEAIVWVRAGLDATQARFYLDRGIGPEEAKRWLGLDLHEEYLDATEYPEFTHYGVYPDWLARWRAAGWTPEDVARFGVLVQHRLGHTNSWDIWQSVFYLDGPAPILDWAVLEPQVAYEAHAAGRTLAEAVALDTGHREAATPALLERLAVLRDDPTVIEDLDSAMVQVLLDAMALALTDADPGSRTHRAIADALTQLPRRPVPGPCHDC